MNQNDLIVNSLRACLADKAVDCVLRALLQQPSRRVDLEPRCETNYAPNQIKALRDAGLPIDDDWVRLGKSKVKIYSIAAEARPLALKAIAPTPK